MARVVGATARPPFVSIVVTVKNAAHTLPHLLEDLVRLDWPGERLELVVVDAHSTDGTFELVQAFAQRAPFAVTAVQKPGYIATGRNEGFRRARGDLVAVTDADMRVPPDWLRQLVSGMDDPRVGVVGGPNETMNDDLLSRCQAAIPTHGPSRGAVPLWGRNKYEGDYATTSDVYAAVTRNSLFRKAAFEAAGGFDESLKVTEDPELNHRILRAGHRIRYRRDAAVRHVHRGTLGAYYRQQRDYAYWQAHVNRKHPALASPKHWAPAAAAAVFVAAVLAGLLLPVAWALAVALAFGAFLLTFYYTLLAALLKRDAGLLLGLPVVFLVWQFAWVVGYPRGAWRARGRA